MSDAMENLAIAATDSSPEILLDGQSGLLRISGESYPENSFEFYRPVKAWIDTYLKQGRAVLLELEIAYMNTSSVKCVLDILETLENAHREQGADIQVRWIYDRDNDRALELAEDFSEDLALPFELVAR